MSTRQDYRRQETYWFEIGTDDAIHIGQQLDDHIFTSKDTSQCMRHSRNKGIGHLLVGSALQVGLSINLGQRV